MEYPNGGESIYPGTNESVRWLSAFNGSKVALEYSQDNGQSWSSIVNGHTDKSGGIVPTEGTYLWYVPNSPSSQALVRVKDSSNTSASDESDAVFTINKYVNITSPNGGESYTRCSTQDIAWHHGGTSGEFRIEYSTDGGTTWSTLVGSGVNNLQKSSPATYSWTLPNVVSSQVKVRVLDVNDTTKYDDSDLDFSITAPPSPVVLSSPNGGEMWVTGTTQSINYTYPTSTTHVNFDYSTDGGSTWTSIATNQAVTGSYSWVVPNTPSSQALVRVTNYANVCDYDISASVFTIASSVQVTQPNGGESWQAQVGQQSIANAEVNMSNATLVVNTVNYYDAGGSSANAPGTTYTQTLVPDNPLNKLQVFFETWDFSNINNYSSYGRINIYAGPDNTYPLIGRIEGYRRSATDRYYRVLLQNQLTRSSTYTTTNLSGINTRGAVFRSTHESGALTIEYSHGSSSGARNFTAFIRSVGTPYKSINWNITGTSKRFDLEYSTDNGLVWHRIVSNYKEDTTGTYQWQVPDVPTTQALVRVLDHNNGAIVDQSNAPFTITAASPFIQVTYPNGGERIYPGKAYEVTWKAPSFNVSSVKIELSQDNGQSYSLIANNVPNSGNYTWFTGAINQVYPNCLIRISKVGQSYVYGESSQLFEMRPGIVIASPNNNNSTWRSCTQSSITWYAGASNNFTIELSLDSGLTYSTLVSDYQDTSFFVNYPWSVPNTPSEMCLIRVTDDDNTTYYDGSDEVFTISPSIELTNFKYGGTLANNTTQIIKWNSFQTSNSYNIYYSTNGGASWTDIAINYSTLNNEYSWSVPSSLTGSILIKVEDYSNTCKSDQSKLPMVVSASPAIQVSSFTSNSVSSCSNLDIQWTSSSNIDSVNILMSKDYGTNWQTVALGVQSTSNPSTYQWTVSNINADVIFKVLNKVNPNEFDNSDSLLTIQKTIDADFTISNSTPCIGDTVVLTSTSSSGNLWSTGETTQSISVTSTGYYSLVVSQGSCIDSTAQQLISFNSLASKPTISLSQNSTCAGYSIVLTSSSSSGNLWLPNLQTTQSIVVKNTGTYSVQVSNGFGCYSTSNPLSLSFTQAPNAPVISSNGPVNIGDTLKLYGSIGQSGLSYSWTGPNSFSSTLQNPFISSVDTTAEGVYSLQTSLNGCSSPTVNLPVLINRINSPFIAGRVTHFNGARIRNVRIDLNGPTNSAIVNDSAGFYRQNILNGGQYTISAFKNAESNKLNGLSTLDLVLIQRHVVLLDTLNNLFDRVAADVNQNGVISTADALIAQRTLLGLDSIISNNSNWVLLSENNGISNTYPYGSNSESIVATGSDSVNYIGVRLGDVNQSWNSQVFKNKRVVNLEVGNYSLKGDTLIVSVANSAETSILGLSGKLIGSEGKVSSSIGSFLSNKLSTGELRFTGYNASQGILVQDEVLRIEIYNPLQLSLSDCLANVQIEGVLSTLEEVDFNLVEKSIGLQENKAVLIVKPNPNSGEFVLESSIDFNSISLYNTAGVLLSENIIEDKNQIRLDYSHLSDGMYLIKVITTDGVIMTNRIIIAK